MALRRIWSIRMLEQELAFSCSYLKGRKGRSRAHYATLATSPTTATGHKYVDHTAHSQVHLGLMKDIRCHFNNVGLASNIGILHLLRQWHPNHVVVQTPKSTGLLKLAKAGEARASLDTTIEQYTSRYFKLSTDPSKAPGHLKDGVQLAKYDYEWQGQKFQLYATEYEENEYSHICNHYIVYPKDEAELVDGRSQAIDRLITTAALLETTVDNEIWIYDRGYWQKSYKLWKAVQASKWERVILSEEMKTQLVADVESFFDREEDYEAFAVPWKRGIILHGLLGNGKTISIKALMRSLSLRDPAIPTLYVKSLGKSSSHDDIRSIFEKARETAPCLMVLEDLDSLVSDNVKSFFLNEMDGLEGNDGIMIIGSTNYLERLDTGISKRPSRFDRKYHFALPATPERIRYCEHWRDKLSNNAALKIPSSISTAVANITEGFSFAYLQEAFVTALLSIVQMQKSDNPAEIPPSTAGSDELESNHIWQAIRKQVDILRKEMRDSRKSVEDSEKNSMMSEPRSGSAVSTGFGLGR